jgi:hypothetical protein
MINQPAMTVRMLLQLLRNDGITNFELSSLRRSVHTLTKRGFLEFVEKKRCPITGEPVGWYRIKPIQTKLFK